MSMSRCVTAALVMFGAAAGACGVETSGELLPGPVDAQSGGRDAARADPSTEAAPSAAPGAGALMGPSVADADAGTDGGPFVTSGQGGPDGGVSSTSSDGAVPLDGGLTGMDGSAEAGALFTCGGSLRCESPGQICCVSSTNRNNGPNAFSCEDGGGCSDPNATMLRCTSAADCTPQVCCLSQQSTQPTTQCSAQCKGGDVPLCDPSAQSTGCVAATACMPMAQNRGPGPLPPGIGTCN
ncbi:MAG: hypothetical protein ACRENE_22480 [Polyangiaceae bacterium]